MKNIIKIISLLLFSISTYSQVTVTASGMTYINGTSISNCGNIDFGTNPTVRVLFTINLTKQSNQVVGVSNLYVYSIGSSGVKIERKNEIVQPANFDTSYQSSADITMSSSDFNATGGTLFVVFKSSGGVEYQTSCSYTITKTLAPTFSLSPTTSSIACNSTNPITFNVTSANIPSGATLTYIWSFSGWSGSSSTNSITLTPNSGTSLPSNVSVTPVLNGVSQTQRTCTITRASFSSIASISGVTDICSGSSNYTISNILAGQVVTWSLSNPSIGSLSNMSNTGATVTFNSSGAQTLNAFITNQCGQTTTKTFIINSGVTTFTSAAVINGSTTFCSGSNTYTITGLLVGQSVTWSLSDPNIASISSASNTQATINFTGSGSQTISAIITNSCGQTATKTLQVYGGVPTFTSFSCNADYDFCSGDISFETYSLPYLSINDRVTAAFQGMTTSESLVNTNWEWQPLNNLVTLSGFRNNRLVGFLNFGLTGVRVRAKNSCGWSNWKVLPFEIIELPPTLERQSISNIYTVYPNPAKDIVNIDLRKINDKPEKEATINGELFNLTGELKSTVQIIDNKATFSVKGLKKGIYVLKIYINDKVESHQIGVE